MCIILSSRHDSCRLILLNKYFIVVGDASLSPYLDFIINILYMCILENNIRLTDDWCL